MKRHCICTLALALSALAALVPVPAAAGEAQFIAALNELKDHVEGTTTLSDTQIANHKSTIDANKGIFGKNNSTITASFDLVSAYDSEIGPLWVPGSAVPDTFYRDEVVDDIHWTMYNVMQNIMDDTYTASNISSHKSLLDGYKFGSSSVFPGAVAPPANPNTTHTSTINGSFPKTFGHDTMHWSDSDHPARKPTGTYLAPGSVATITVPASLVGQGYSVRVGGNSWDFSNKNQIDRLDRFSLAYSIDSTEIEVASPLGGGIYIEVPYLADAGIVDVQIKNAVRSPFFSAKSFDMTTLAEWQNTERHHPAPWADFQSEKFMMQVPTQWIANLADPVTLMADWDKAMDVTNDLMGFPHDRGKETMFSQVDVRLRVNAYNPGYPSVNVRYDPRNIGTSNHHLFRGPQFARDYEFHEAGHGYLMTKFPGETESDVNLLHVAVMNVGFGKDLEYAFASSRGYEDNPNRTMANTAVAWMTSFNFSPREVEMHQKEKQYQLKGHAKFVEIARLFGWEVLGDYYKSFNDDHENGIYYRAEHGDTDKLLLRMSKNVGADITPLFHFWGIIPEDPDDLKAAIAAENLPVSEEIYHTLVEYRSLIPADNSEFRQFALGWWGRQPTVDGHWTESDHARQWDETHLYESEDDVAQRPNGEIYNETSAAEITAHVNEIIDLYFPTPFPTYPLGDLNFDEVVDVLDWPIFLAGNQGDFTGKTEEEAYVMGDLDGDFDNDVHDFDLFEQAYDAANGAGAFAAMVASVPEPASFHLLLLAAMGLSALRQRKRA